MMNGLKRKNIPLGGCCKEEEIYGLNLFLRFDELVRILLKRNMRIHKANHDKHGLLQ